MKHRNKWSYDQKQKFVKVLADLLANGFSLKDSLAFMAKTASFPRGLLLVFRKHLAVGRPLSASFAKCGYTVQQVAQIRLAEQHGNLVRTLRNLARQMALVAQQKKNLQKAVTYPGLLLFFLLGILLAMREIVLPQLLAGELVDKEHFGIRFLQQFPVFLGSAGLAAVSIFCGVKFLFKRQSPLLQARFLARLPLAGQLYRSYLSGYFALEWGKLFQEGLELKHVVFCMKKTEERSVMKALALEMELGMRQGQSLVEQLERYSFFTKEFILIVRQGEAKGKLGAELVWYSELIWQQFFQKIEQVMTWIQPIVFLLVAAAVVMIYGALMLPIYGNMEDIL